MNDYLTFGPAKEFEDLLSVREAARLVRVSESTVWRWINEGVVPSHRVGRKRVYLKRAELTPLLRPARTKGGDMSQREREKLNLSPLNPDRPPDVDPVAQARALHANWRAEHGGKTMPEAWEDINEARDQRTRELDAEPPQA